MTRHGWKMGWGQWHDGYRYAIRVGEMEWSGNYRGRSPVMVADRQTGGLIVRMGDVRIIGNFSPIWITVKGKRSQLTELLRVE